MKHGLVQSRTGRRVPGLLAVRLVIDSSPALTSGLLVRLRLVRGEDCLRHVRATTKGSGVTVRYLLSLLIFGRLGNTAKEVPRAHAVLDRHFQRWTDRPLASAGEAILPRAIEHQVVHVALANPDVKRSGTEARRLAPGTDNLGPGAPV